MHTTPDQDERAVDHPGQAQLEDREEHAAGRRILKRKHDLENLRVVEAPLRRNFTRQLLEWNILVAIGIQCRCARLLQQIRKTLFRIEPHPHHNGTGKISNHFFQARVLAVRNGSSDQDIVLTAVALQ